MLNAFRLNFTVCKHTNTHTHTHLSPTTQLGSALCMLHSPIHAHTRPTTTEHFIIVALILGMRRKLPRHTNTEVRPPDINDYYYYFTQSTPQTHYRFQSKYCGAGPRGVACVTEKGKEENLSKPTHLVCAPSW